MADAILFGNKAKLNVPSFCDSHLKKWKHIFGKRWQKKPFIEIIKKKKKTKHEHVFLFNQAKYNSFHVEKQSTLSLWNNPARFDQAVLYRGQRTKQQFFVQNLL